MSRAGNAAQVHFLDFKGKAIKLTSLTLAQHEELAQYLRHRYFSECKSQFKDLPIELAKYALDKAKEKTDKIYPGMVEHAEQFYQPHGQIYCLMLAMQPSNPEVTIELASEIFSDVPTDAAAIVSKAAGFDSEAKQSVKPLPIQEIIHRLCNEPYNHTAAEVKAMTLDDIALVLCEPETTKGVSADQVARVVEAAKKRKEQQKLGVWNDTQLSIWKSQ